MDSNKKEISVQVADSIDIELEENPTTGFNWEVEDVSADLCQLVSSMYRVAAGAGIGGGGVRTMVFQPKKTGKGVIKLKNCQRWSGEVYQRFEVSLNITA